MKSRILTAMLAVALCLSVFGGASAAVSVDVHYNDWAMPIAGNLEKGTTYVPLRQFFQLLGGSWVTWDSTQRSATVQGKVNATFYLNSDRAWFGGSSQKLTGHSYLSGGVMYVPLRGIARLLDCGIRYDSRLQRVTLSTGNTYSTGADGDSVYWLSRIIEAESGGEPYRGKVAVGNVILNRVRSKDFPNTIYGVIFDRNNGVQFTPVANGTIYNTPSADSIRAAEACLTGASEAADCLYFFNPKTATKAAWIRQNCRYYTSIGNHDFYQAK